MTNDDDWSERPTSIAPQNAQQGQGATPAQAPGHNANDSANPASQAYTSNTHDAQAMNQQGQQVQPGTPPQSNPQHGQAFPPNQPQQGTYQPQAGQPYQPQQNQPTYGQQPMNNQGMPAQNYGQAPAQPPYNSGGFNQQSAGQQAPNQPSSSQAAPVQPAHGQNTATNTATGTQGFQSFPQNQQSSTKGPFGKASAGPADLGSKLGWGLVAGGVLTLIGLLGAWITMKYNLGGSYGGDHSISVNGLGRGVVNDKADAPWKVHGYIILILAVAAIVVGAMRALGKLPKVAAWAGTAAGLITLALSIYDWSDIHDQLVKANDGFKGLSSDASFSGGVGWGLILTVVAGLVMAVTGALSALKD